MRRRWPSNEVSRGWFFGIWFSVAIPTGRDCVTTMTFRFVLGLISLVLSLAISADRPSTACRGCWLATPGAPTIDQSLGVNIHFTSPEPGEIKMIADAGFHWVRMDFSWAATERESGRYDFSAYDRLMKELDAFNLRALFILDYGNPLYGDGAPRTEKARQAFAVWAVAAARHFANRGVIWEVYNEPNNSMFWKRPNPNEYAALSIAVGRAFRQAVPQERLIGPAAGEMDFSFLEACFKAGALGSWSAVSVHPYLRTNPEGVAAEYSRLRELIDRYRKPNDEAGKSGLGPSGMPIISSEWGYSSVWPGMNEERQAVILARQFLTNAANGIPLSIWYDWRDDGTEPAEYEHHFGLVRNQIRTGQATVYEPKPAYLAAQTLITHFRGFRFAERLKVGSADDYVLVFVKNGERRMAAWTTSATSQQVAIPEATGEFSITKLTGQPAGRLSVNQGTLSLRLTNAPIYLARLP